MCAIKRPTTYRKRQILHHAAHTTHITGALVLALAGQQVLNAAVGVDLHSAQVFEAIDQTRLLAELLAEGIAKVVGGVGRDEQDRTADLGQLDSQTARCCRLTDTALAADEDPAQRALVENRLEGGLQVVVVGVDDCGRHFEDGGRLSWLGIVIYFCRKILGM